MSHLNPMIGIQSPGPTYAQVNELLHRFFRELQTDTVFGLDIALYNLRRHPVEFRVEARHHNHSSLVMQHRQDSVLAGPRIDQCIVSGNFDGDKAREWLEQRYMEYQMIRGTPLEKTIWLSAEHT